MREVGLKQTDFIKAVMFIIVAYVSVSLMNVFVKLSSETLPSSEILFFRFFIGLLCIIPFMLREKTFTFKTVGNKYFLLRSVTGLVSMMLMFYSLRLLPTSVAIMLMNTSPLFMPLMVFILYREKTSLPVMACTLVGFLGVCIALSSMPENIPTKFIVAGVGSAVFASLAYLGIKELGNVYSPWQIVFHFHLFSCVFIALLLSSNWVVPTVNDIYLLTLVGVAGVVFQFFVTKAFSYADTIKITPFIFTGVIFSGIVDWLFWDVTPSWHYWGGITLIIGAILVMLKQQHRGSRHYDERCP